MDRLHLNEKVKNIVVELIPNSANERDDLLKVLSSIDHIESIYLLGEPPETNEERFEFFAKFPKICVFCKDTGQLAMRWTIDTVEECRTLGDQYIKEGKKEIARLYFERGMQLFKQLGKLIDSTNRK